MDFKELYRKLANVRDQLKIKFYANGRTPAICSDDSLYELAKQAPRHKEDLCKINGLGEICVPNIHKKLDNIRMGCFKHIYTYLRKERKVIEQDDIESCIIKVDEDCLKTPEDYTRVRKIIKQLNLTQNELKTLYCFYNQKPYTNITEFLHIDRRTVARRKKKIQEKYLQIFSNV